VKDKRAMRIVDWLDEVSEGACSCRVEVHALMRREGATPPTDAEAACFVDGLVVGLQIASVALEDAVETGHVPERSALDSVAKALGTWMGMREERAREAM